MLQKALKIRAEHSETVHNDRKTRISHLITYRFVQYEHFWQTHTLSTSNIVSPQQGHIIAFIFLNL